MGATGLEATFEALHAQEQGAGGVVVLALALARRSSRLFLALVRLRVAMGRVPGSSLMRQRRRGFLGILGRIAERGWIVELAVNRGLT